MTATSDLELVGGGSAQRQHIIDVALRLMAEQGAGPTSMRQLARECDVNVATIYHYFPSKADILRSVIEERRYDLRLEQDLPRPEPGTSPSAVLVTIIEEIWVGALAEEPIWRLVLGEALRGDETAIAVGADLLETIESALTRWLAAHPETAPEAATAAAVITGQLYTSLLERVFRPDRDLEAVRERAADLVALITAD